LLLGAALFALHTLTGAQGDGDARRRVVVTPELREQLAERYRRERGREPAPEELQEALADWLREELLYREGLARGLMEGDPIIRRRLGQKLMMLAEASAPLQPAAGELESWLAEHREDYREPPRYSFEQRFFPQGAAPERLERALAALREDPAAAVGEATLLPQSVDGAAESWVARTFGEEFLASLDTLPSGQWSGPLRSAFGQHLLRLEEVSPGRLPALEEVRDWVLGDWAQAQKRSARERYYRALRDEYEVLGLSEDP